MSQDKLPPTANERVYKGDIVGWLRRRTQNGAPLVSMPSKLADEIADHIESLQNQVDTLTAALAAAKEGAGNEPTSKPHNTRLEARVGLENTEPRESQSGSFFERWRDVIRNVSQHGDSDGPAAQRRHITQAGESVMGIALRELGDEDAWRDILACNPRYADMGPHHYFPVGTVIILPDESEQADRKGKDNPHA